MNNPINTMIRTGLRPVGYPLSACYDHPVAIRRCWSVSIDESIVTTKIHNVCSVLGPLRRGWTRAVGA
jgi:hypothetical protein